MQKCFELLKHAPRFTVLTGAGVSTLSGISDFRGKNGFYTKGDLLYGVKREDLFDLDFFNEHPEIFYRYAADFLYPMLKKEPSIAHKTLAAMQKKGLCQGIFTQNIDTLHSKAGAPDVVELHGTMGEHFCTECGTKYALSEVLPQGAKGEVPLCKSCSGVIKPAVVFFGEMLPQEAFERAFRECAAAGILLVMGSSLTVTPVANLPEVTLNHGGKVIIVNEQSTSFDREAAFRFKDISEFCQALSEYFNL
jgi:NAD-dependent deacetylase